MAFGDFTVTRSTTKWVLNSSGVLSEVAINTPAFEFNADGTYRGLLVEPAATNLALRSAEFDNVYWTKNNATVSANATTSPNGLTAADKLVANNLSTISSIERLITGVSSGATHTVSVFYKASGAAWIRLVASIVSGGTSPARAWFNASTGAVGTNNGGFSRIAVTSYGSGWYRAEATFVTSLTEVTIFFGLSDADNSNNYAGNGTDGAFFWGAQLETGSVATSYIPTVASTANRTADSVTLTGASSLIGQTQNTLYIEGEIRTSTGASDGCLVALTDGTSDDAIVLRTIAANGRIGAVVRDGGTNQAEITSGSFTTGLFKCAIASATNDVAFYLNGSSVGTDASATHPVLNQYQLGGTVATVAPTARTMWLRAVANFPSRLANATLATLTTL